MTEAEWLTCAEPRQMEQFLRGSPNPSPRKFRFYALACVRHLGQHFSGHEIGHWCRAALAVTEPFSDGDLSEEQRAAAQAFVVRVRAFLAGKLQVHVRSAVAACFAVADDCHDGRALHCASRAVHRTWLTMCSNFGRPGDYPRILADAIRDIFGNPFRPLSVSPAWLTLDVVELARGIYIEQVFDRLPILADALEEAGCGNPDILSHCRQPGVHVRGCWVVDHLLDKA